MPALNWKRKVILFKNEAVYATDPVPTNIANAVLARNVSISPLELVTDDRNVELPFVGDQGKIVAGQYVKLDYEVEMASAGAAGTAAPYGPMLKSCGMSQTINAGVSAVYALIDPGTEVSGTAYFYMGGRLHSTVGCRGNATITLARGKVPTIKFSFMGLFVGPSDAALPVPTLTAWQAPLAVNNVNTNPFTLHTFAGKFSELSINFGSVLTYRNLPNLEAIQLTDRKVMGTVKLEDELVATKNFWTIMDAGTTGALAITHGQAAGSKVVIAAPAVQLSGAGLAADENISTLSMNMDLKPSATGNDEFTFTVQ